MASHNIALGASISAAVAGGSPGDTYNFAAGTYRGQHWSPKNGDIYIGNAGGTILSGGALVSAWTNVSGNHYTATAGTMDSGSVGFGSSTGSEELFVDKVRLTKVADNSGDPGAGNWYLHTATNTLHINQASPGSHLIEYEMTGQFIDAAVDLTFQNFTWEMYFGGDIFAGGGTKTIINCIGRNCFYRAFSNSTDPIYLYNSKFLSCGENGIGGSPRRGVMRNCEIGFIAPGRTSDDGQAGAIKLTFATNFVIDNCHIHNSGAYGVWFDVNSINCTVSNCLIENCTASGIFYEISWAGKFYNNTIKNIGVVGTGAPFGGNDACITLSSSGACEVFNNTCWVLPGKVVSGNSPWGGLVLINSQHGTSGSEGEGGVASFTGSISGTTLTVSGISGTLTVNAGTGMGGMEIHGAGVFPGQRLISQLSGTAGSNGTYQLSLHNQTVGSTSMFGAHPFVSVLWSTVDNYFHNNIIVWQDSPAGVYDLYFIDGTQNLSLGSGNNKNWNTYYTPNTTGSFYGWAADNGSPSFQNFTWAAYQSAGHELQSTNIVGLPPTNELSLPTLGELGLPAPPLRPSQRTAPLFQGQVTLHALNVSTVTTGGTAVTAITAGNRAAGGWIKNPENATANLGINEQGTASGSSSSGATTFIAPGELYYLQPTGGAVSVVSSVSGHIFAGMGWS